jgi:poly-gamma-glutamate capsule biosynthesis protein CapA/YwtB (metallophosphatase superfamily)
MTGSTLRSRWTAIAAALGLVTTLAAADAAWQWSGPFGDKPGDKSVSMLIIGDVDIQLRADPTTAFAHIGETLKRADVVYANLEGMLVKPEGPEKDIPDKRGWRHPGPEGVLALKAWNVKVVGVANNVAYDRKNILETLRVLDANGIVHTGGGRNIAEAHKPAIVERKGVKIGFLQYTARWYQDSDQIATATEPGVAKIASRDGITIDPADVDRVRADIRALRPQVDILVVSHHNRDGATATQFGAPPARAATAGTRRDNHISEEYQKQFAHLAHDAGADFVYGHGTHTVQGVEVYNGKPILYAIGHSAFDQPGYENSKDGLVVRVVIDGKRIRRVSFVPVTRDAKNDVVMVDPSAGDGAALVKVVKDLSPGVPLKIEGHEVVLLDAPAQVSRRTGIRD